MTETFSIYAYVQGLPSSFETSYTAAMAFVVILMLSVPVIHHPRSQAAWRSTDERQATAEAVVAPARRTGSIWARLAVVSVVTLFMLFPIYWLFMPSRLQDAGRDLLPHPPVWWPQSTVTVRELRRPVQATAMWRDDLSTA